MDYSAFILCGLLFSIALNIIFFTKKHIISGETRIFSMLSITNLVGLILEYLCAYLGNNFPPELLITKICTKLYLSYLVTFILLMTLYIYVICYITSKILQEKHYYKLRKLSFLIYFLCLFFIAILPIETAIGYATGPAVNFVFICATISMIIWLIPILKNIKKINLTKIIPLICFIIFISIISYIQKINPEFTLITVMEFLIIFIMYHTIENPDINLLRAISNKKDEATRINNDKAMFLFNMSQDIKKPVMDIQIKCENTLMGETVDEFKDGIRSIKESANQASRLINASLNISESSSANLKLVNKRYNVNLLFKQLIEMTKTKLKDKNVEFRYNIDDSIPEYLMGDSIRFKQMVSIIINNAIKHTDYGYIELDVSYIIRADICSFIINIIDTGKGMSQEKLDEALNSSKEVTGNTEDIATAKTLAGLSNGTIMGVSESEKGSKFTIIVNQKIADEENDSIDRSVLKVDSDKKILIVENDEKTQNKIIKLLKDENISIEITNMGVGCLEKIRKGSHYDLILINEELPKLSGILTYQKLKLINNFNTPVIMMIDESHKEYIEKYLDLGIKKCLIKQEKKIIKDNILEVLRKN